MDHTEGSPFLSPAPHRPASVLDVGAAFVFLQSASDLAGKGGIGMVFIQAQDYRFYYPEDNRPAVSIESLTIEKGSFCLLAGTSGSGKTTLLRQLSGNPVYQGKEEGHLSCLAGTAAYVQQNPENQIVTDRVEYELVFGLENRGMPKEQMQRRLAEVVTFFGLEELMERDTMSLSGGEKQILNVAAAIAMNPDLLLLDEPTSQLDPVAARHFFELLHQINEELGITIMIAEQRLEDVTALADQIVLMQKGNVCFQGKPDTIFDKISDHFLSFFPSYMQLYKRTGRFGEVPLTKKAARNWFCDDYQAKKSAEPGERNQIGRERKKERIQCRGLCFRYERSSPDVLRECSFSFARGEITCLAGGNGSGKSTLLEHLYGTRHGYRGKIKNLPGRRVFLPQQPQYLFLGDTVEQCISADRGPMGALLAGFGLDGLRQRHPADLSGGEKQKLALCQVLGTEAELYLLDEPTKGMDMDSKHLLGQLLRKLADEGRTIFFVSHDMEFAAKYADTMALMFQGDVPLVADTRDFFVENQFYTTCMNRIAREVSPYIITLEDVERYAETKDH